LFLASSSNTMTNKPYDRRFFSSTFSHFLKMFCLWHLYLIYTLTHTHSTRAQTTNTICNNNSTTSFTFNQAGESPWYVVDEWEANSSETWSKLQSLCIPDSAFVNVPPLIDGTYGYNPPSEGSPCQCNIAAYNLMVSYLNQALRYQADDRPHVAGELS